MFFVITRHWNNPMCGSKMKETEHLHWNGRTAKSALTNFLNEDYTNPKIENMKASISFGYGMAECEVNGMRYVAIESDDQSAW